MLVIPSQLLLLDHWAYDFDFWHYSGSRDHMTLIFLLIPIYYSVIWLLYGVVSLDSVLDYSFSEFVGSIIIGNQAINRYVGSERKSVIRELAPPYYRYGYS